ncbi:MAG: tRNA (5-methylaminomethyl-2-thiouridine)(34)-methyltransferase MnmD [Methylophilaceae bacterium]
MQYAHIQWVGNQPYSIDFNDVYFSTDHGLQETEYVFIAQNQLIERFSAARQSLVIMETGFGTGLNFFCTASHWLTLAPANVQLHYISTEKLPLKLKDMVQTAQLWSALAAISSALLPLYSGLQLGLNTFYLFNQRVRLDLWVGDITDILPHLNHPADIWFLDGFAPAKNAEMWSDYLFTHMARLSQKDTTFATFTSASAVRKSLQAHGFEVKKQIGFGKKREMLFGRFIGKAT